MNGPAAALSWLAMTPLLVACGLPLPRDFDGKPVQAVRLVGVFEGGVLVVQRSNAPARVIVELAVEDLAGATMDGLSLRVGKQPPLLPTRLHRDQPGCDATSRRDRSRQAQPTENGMSPVTRTMPCLTWIRAEFLLARPPTTNDSLFIITRDGRSLPVRWYR